MYLVRLLVLAVASLVLTLLGVGAVSASNAAVAHPRQLSAPILNYTRPLKHPGALHTIEDIERIRKNIRAQRQPWYRAWQHLETVKLAQVSWKPTPQRVLTRGSNATFAPPQTYQYAYRDAHSAYTLTLRYLLGGNESYANQAVTILNAWSSTLIAINGTEDKFLAAGLYGYQFANAGELLRTYHGWLMDDQRTFGKMLYDVFAPYNRDFLEYHNNKPNFYYANWDLCNIASLMAIGIFNDNRTMFEYALSYWKHGLPSGEVANGALPFFSIANFTEADSGKTLMQIQESGRDQAHALLCLSLVGVIAQQGWSQGEDLFSTYGNQILEAAEYSAKYNTNHTVPYEPYTSWEGLLKVISPKARGDIRPGFEAIYSHYAELKGMNASWSLEFRDYVNRNISAHVEGGGGDYSPNSGGYDSLGHGTLLYRLKEE